MTKANGAKYWVTQYKNVDGWAVDIETISRTREECLIKWSATFGWSREWWHKKVRLKINRCVRCYIVTDRDLQVRQLPWETSNHG